MGHIVVQKFGGTSLQSAAARERAIRHIERAIEEGMRPVVVVSAMGRRGDPYATDTLMALAEAEGGELDARDTDLLLSCGEVISAAVMAQALRRKGLSALALTGAQAGIVTDESFGDARILRIDGERVLQAVEAGRVPVVTGFQGVSLSGEVTTLGRGGSDTTAAALAVRLGAALLEVYTDVDGVKTADPRLVPEAVTLPRATYREVAELAHLGAKVIHPRAVEIAMNGQLPLKIKPTASDGAGTLVSDALPGNALEGAGDRPVTGIAYVLDRAQVVVEPPEAGDGAVQLFHALGEAAVSADMIHVAPDRIAFIVEGKALRRVERILENAGWQYQVKKSVAKVSAVGAGMHGVPGVMARVAACLQREGVPIFQTSDSHANISCLVPEERVREAVVALHEEFHLASVAAGGSGRLER